MRKDELQLANDPDLYSRELHYQLLITGPRSQGVRRLMRLARKHPGGELERILETKINEYKRHQRETRVPSLWNAPARMLEWASDHVALTPHLDVGLTLVYVVIALVGAEIIKGAIWQETLDDKNQVTASASLNGPSNGTGPKLAAEMAQASQTEAFAEVLRSQLRILISEGQLKGPTPSGANAPGLKAHLQAEVDAYLMSQEFRDRMRNTVSKEGAAIALPSDPKQAPVDEEISERIAGRLYDIVMRKTSQADWSSGQSESARDALARKLLLELADEVPADEELLAEVTRLFKDFEEQQPNKVGAIPPAIAEKPIDSHRNAGGN